MSIDFMLGLIVGLMVAKFMIIAAFLTKRHEIRLRILQDLDRYEHEQAKKRGLR